jgi:hypothetical protein
MITSSQPHRTALKSSAYDITQREVVNLGIWNVESQGIWNLGILLVLAG